MADNTLLNSGTGGDTIATADTTSLNGGAVSGVKVQRVKVGYGTGATHTDVASGSPLPTLPAGAVAAGSAVTGNPLLVGGSDGTNARFLSVDTSGRPAVTGQGAAAAATAGNPLRVGGTFVTTLPTYTTGQQTDLQTTARGEVLVALSSGATAVAVKAASTAAATADPALVVSFAGANSATKIGDGTNNATIKAASTAAAFTDVALVVDTRPGGAHLTASAAMADAFANPTLGKQAVVNMVYNGSTWDLQRGMSGNLTTGDTGAKTATGNGATQTNVGNKGVQVVVNMGTVSGTTPTCVLKLQGSADGGTTWYDIPGATTASLTATGVFGIMLYPGVAVTAGTTTTGTTAGANGVLPRTWRVVWTIGGTTPSFTITNIQYNYLPN